MMCDICGEGFADQDLVIPVLLHTISADKVAIVSWNRPVSYIHLYHLKDQT